MATAHQDRIAAELRIPAGQVAATVALLDDDATVPFIARYRKEATGELDEVQITSIRDRIQQLREMDKRRETMIKSLTERDLLTDELAEALNTAETLAELEDIYLPFRPKRRTRATIARERGLEPLAEIIFDQGDDNTEEVAEEYVDPEKDVPTVDDALAGARDIIAEWVNEDADVRARMRDLFTVRGTVRSRLVPGKETEGAKFSDYFDWEEPLSECASHRLLAIRRGETEGVLSLRILPPEDEALDILLEIFVINETACAGQVALAVRDSYQRLLGPAMETEVRMESRRKADEEAIRVFAQNLRELLMSAPLGQKNVMALDPGFRTGCKLVCLDRQGNLKHNETIYPHTGDQQRDKAAKTVEGLCKKFNIEVIAIGNGTAGRETESFVRGLALPADTATVMVNESGASIYSASEAAREEFPDYDITVRGAVSIGRRLMDPLAELVKIDPKSIGVGQYQHDVDQGWLRQGLDDTVMSCVNAVGVEINTASKQLLAYVSGLGPALAQNIITYRTENGPFESRKSLLKVPRLGPKAFEQAAGFLRVANSPNPLDRSAVHPERYKLVDQIARDLKCEVADLMTDESRRQSIQLKQYVSEEVGLPTLRDIMEELAKPGRDPRKQFEVFSFDDSVREITDVKTGMVLPGIVTNVTNFGAFVDIGVHQDGLVHISELADRYVSDPTEIVKVHQQVKVTVLAIDLERKRISLSMKTQH